MGHIQAKTILNLNKSYFGEFTDSLVFCIVFVGNPKTTIMWQKAILSEITQLTEKTLFGKTRDTG